MIEKVDFSVRMLTRVQIKMWAVVRIQRCFKRFLKRKSQQRESKKKVSILMIIATLTRRFPF